VLENLISNALRHTPAGGQATLVVTRVAHRAQVCVSDTGCGIPEEELPRIFERSSRGTSSRSVICSTLTSAIRRIVNRSADLEADCDLAAAKRT